MSKGVTFRPPSSSAFRCVVLLVLSLKVSACSSDRPGFRLESHIVGAENACTNNAPVFLVQTVRDGCEQISGVLGGTANYSTILTLGAAALKVSNMKSVHVISSDKRLASAAAKHVSCPKGVGQHVAVGS